ncbi:hypothetical protein HYW40_00005, partial [Candidatus Curtissbacteria bacterium]|nr:hypothetical protein [Candidatus Curtissbacteria bacterium]
MVERTAVSEPNFIRRFEIQLSGLTEVERQLSERLVEAAVGTAPIYEEQQNDLFPGANLYPHDATAKEIEEAANQNPEILSEYTTVKRAGDGKLTAIPYHHQYHQLLVPVVEKLIEAAEICEDQDLKNYLILRSQSLLDGDYEKSEKVWIANPEPTVDIVIGPYDRYIDKLFSRKYAYLSWSGIIDREQTQEAQQFINSFLAVYGWNGSPIRARVDKTRIFSGLASIGWSANNLPCQADWREKYGSKVTIFAPSFHARFQNRLAALHSILPASKEFEDDHLEGVSRIFLFAHETCHPLIRRPGDESRLKGQYSTVSELYCDLLGIHVAKNLIGRRLSEQDWYLLMPTFISW